MELRQKIADAICNAARVEIVTEDGDKLLTWDDFSEEEHVFFYGLADKLIKDLNLVQLDENQELPPIPRKDIAHIIMERDRILLNAGFRRIK